MAEFPQSAASRAALQDAARDYLNQRILSGKSSERAKEFHVTQKTIQRWRASLSGSSAQKRNPLAKGSSFGKGKVHVKLVADFDYGDDPEYHRDKKPMHTMLDGLPRTAFFHAALNDPDEAWEMFLNNYGVIGTVENVQSIRFQ